MSDRGARASNAGDQFHELWALSQVLTLLSPTTALTAVTLEGVKTESETQSTDTPTWDGVDCALYFNGRALEQADRVEFVQLKYSSANPDKAWTVARLTASSGKKVNNSAIKKLADDFKDAKTRLKAGGEFKLRFISNQNLSPDLQTAIAARWIGNVENAGLSPKITASLVELRSATGLSQENFSDFVARLDFSECGHDSRFALREKVIDIAISLLGDDVSSEVRELQQRVREVMLPEDKRAVITEKEVLLWLGVSSRDGLFPCPPDIRFPAHVIGRAAAREVADLLAAGERFVLVHGPGGCGKTTLTRQIAEHLPGGSVSILFDCFGGGRYIHSDDKRHLPENAFLQLTNDLAVALGLPLFIPRNFKHPASIRTFMAALQKAGAALEQLAPTGLLLIEVDAADNSISAANNPTPPDPCFVIDLLGAHLAGLPKNIRFVVSCRSGRRSSLPLPATAKQVECAAFSIDETRLNLTAAFSDASEEFVEQFHALTHGVPRVQAYAMASAAGDSARLLDALRPNGKSLSDVLELTFDAALQKHGQRELFERLLAALAFLPKPADINAVAGIAGSDEAIVRDLAIDLAPGLRIEGDVVSVADEDFENFIEQRSQVRRETTTAEIASYFLGAYLVDSYSSVYVADALYDARRPQDILAIVERDPQASAIGDPVLRRQTQARRLTLSIAACKVMGSTVDALKTILTSAEAESDERTLHDVLENQIDLSVEFSAASLRRSILLDPDRVQDQGSVLAHDALRAIRAGDRISAHEQLYFHDAWLSRRKSVPQKEMEEWKVTDKDIAARVETVLGLAGPRAAVAELRRWSPRFVALDVTTILVPLLIASGKASIVAEIARNRAMPRPWDLLLWVPLAMSGAAVEPTVIECSLKALRPRFIPDASRFATSYGEEAWQVTLFETLVTACELGFRLSINKDILSTAIAKLLRVLEGDKKRLFTSDYQRLDGLMRCWLLRSAINGSQAKVDDFVAFVAALAPVEPKEEDTSRKKRKKAPTQDRGDKERSERKLRALYPIYEARVAILAAAANGREIASEDIAPLGKVGGQFYDFDFDYESSRLREVAAQSVMRLLLVPNLKAAALVECAGALIKGRYSDGFGSRRLPLWTAMRLRVDEASALVQITAKVADEIKAERASASDKLEAIVRVSRLILPVSRPDAESLFNDAIVIAKELDHEAFDQIEFLASATPQAKFADDSARRAAALSTYIFVFGAAERLADNERFPWRSGIRALTILDLPTALAAISRWSDDGTLPLEDSIDYLLTTALAAGTLTPRIAASLVLLTKQRDKHAQSAIVAKISSRDDAMLVEELCRDVLLLCPQKDRYRFGTELVERATRRDMPSGFWLDKLEQTVSFIGSEEAQDKSEKGEPTGTEVVPVVDGDLKRKTFDYDFTDKVFDSSSSIAGVLKQARASQAYYSETDVLRKMREASSRPKDRVPFLDAVMGLTDEDAWGGVRTKTIFDAIMEWKGTPSVDHWCRETLPKLLVAHFPLFSRWLKDGESALPELLRVTGLNAEDRVGLIIEGVAESGPALNSRVLFGIADLIVADMRSSDTGALVEWYAKRMRARIPGEVQLDIDPGLIPAEPTEAIARLLYAAMSDIDTRIRWRAAHALRRLAKFGCREIVEATIAEVDRREDKCFRDPTAPFYFLSAQLWLFIALYRISAESPQALASCKATIFSFAVSSEFPHVAIREYAKRTALTLATSGTISFSASERKKLAEVNKALRGTRKGERPYGRSFDQRERRDRRFHFDELDTIRYWYVDLLRIFPTVTQDEVLDIAERWIVDVWGAGPEANWWDKEPRKRRYDERRFGLWSHSHGSFPTLERYGTHLEWNAMYCVAGELLRTHPIVARSDVSYDTFDYWINKVLPTAPPEWLADTRSPTPLEPRLWRPDKRTDAGWLRNVRLDEMLAELMPTHQLGNGLLVVGSNYSVRFATREVNAHVHTALVAPEASLSLLRALDTASNPYDFKLPDDDDGDDRFEINDPPYRLLGWLISPENEARFDDADPISYDISPLRCGPGREITRLFKLRHRLVTSHEWLRPGADQASFRFEAWKDEPPAENDSYYRGVKSDGWRLCANASEVQAFLSSKEMDLICEIQVERRLRSEYNRSYDEQKKSTHTKIFLLKSDGSIEGVQGRVGAWAIAGAGASSRSGCRHARPLDGPPHRRAAPRRRKDTARQS